MWTSKNFGHHDKMARTKTHRTHSLQRRNRQSVLPYITESLVYRKDCQIYLKA